MRTGIGKGACPRDGTGWFESVVARAFTEYGAGAGDAGRIPLVDTQQVWRCLGPCGKLYVVGVDGTFADWSG